MLLGATPAASRTNLTNWLDTFVSGVATDIVFAYDHRRQRMEGHYPGLQDNECRDILSKLSGLSEWAAECTTTQLSCGTLIVITSGGRGRTTSAPILCGPFQKCY